MTDLFLSFSNHSSRNIGGSDNGPLLSERNRQRPSSTTSVTNSNPTKRTVISQHSNGILDCFRMAKPNVFLNPVHIVGLTVNLLPPLEPRVVEVLPHHLLVVSADLLCLVAPPSLGVGEGEYGCEGGD